MPLLDRRQAILKVGACLGGIALVGAERLAAAMDRAGATAQDSRGARGAGFSAAQVALLDEIAETILPETKTPGAKAAHTGAFMAFMVTDAYSSADRQVFLDGMRDVDMAMLRAHKVSFVDATSPQRLALLTALDIEQKRVMDDRIAPGSGDSSERRQVHYFRMMKELAMLGFFTSSVGCTQVLRYVETPGRYDPCMPYTAGEPAWTPHA